MPDKNLASMGNKSFEDLKEVNEYGAEYWSAREIQPHLGYAQWRRFEDAIKRAITSCKQSGNTPENHFAGAGKMVDIGSQTGRELDDYHLSRFACYPLHHLLPTCLGPARKKEHLPGFQEMLLNYVFVKWS